MSDRYVWDEDGMDAAKSYDIDRQQYVTAEDYDALAERLRKEVSAAYGMAIRKQERIEQIEARLAEAEEVLDSFGACPNPGNCRNCADKLAAYVSKRESPWFNPWTGKMSDGTTVTVPVGEVTK